MLYNQYCATKKFSNEKREKSQSNFFQIQNNCFNQIRNDQEDPPLCHQKETTDICRELKECKLNDFMEQKRRQRLHSNNHELRQLKTQLQSALIFKQLREQQNYLEQQKKEELLKKREENLEFEAECAKAKEDKLKEDQEIKWKREEFCGVLTEQVDELRRRRRLEFENVIKDREEAEKLVKRIQREELQKHEIKKSLQEMYRIEMEESCRNSELRKQLEKKKNDDDNERYLAYQKKCDEFQAKVAAEKKNLQKEKEAVSERIGNQLHLIHNEKQKREDLLLSLLQEERKAKEDESYRQSLEKQMQRRKELQTDQAEYYNIIRIQKEKQLKEEEEKLRDEHLLHLTERDKLDQLSDEKRRRKKLEHRKALKDMIELRRKERAKEIAERINEYEKLMVGEKQRETLIEEERIRILSTAPKELLKYLPPGVLKLSDKEFLTLSGQY